MRQKIVDTARSWIGTPYHHHQALKGVGVDCLGLVAAVAVELGIEGEYDKTTFAPFQGYSRNPNPRQMTKAMERFLIPVEVPQIGDIAWLETRPGVANHLAIKTGDDTIVHACGIVKKVIETTMPPRSVTWWKFGGLDE